MPRREPDGDTGVEVAIDRLRSLDRRLSDLEAWVAGKLPHTHAMDGVSSRAARVHLGSSQSISNNTSTKVELDTVLFDPHGLFDSANNQIVLDKTGMWAVSSQIRFASNSTGGLRQNQLQRAGTFEHIVKLPPSSSSDVIVVGVSVVEAASTSDAVELFAKQDSGGALDVLSGFPWTFLSVAYLGS